MFILLGARVFSLTFYGVNGHRWVEELLVSLPGGETGFLIFVNALIFVLAFFLDYFELAFIVIPLIGPAADHLGIDLVWLGVMLAVNMQTSFLHPPFGFALFFLRSVAPKDSYLDRVTGKATRGRHDRPDLLGRGAVRGDPADHGGDGDPVPGPGDALQVRRADRSIPRPSRSRCRCRARTCRSTSSRRAFPISQVRPRCRPCRRRCRRPKAPGPEPNDSPSSRASGGMPGIRRATRDRVQKAARTRKTIPALAALGRDDEGMGLTETSSSRPNGKAGRAGTARRTGPLSCKRSRVLASHSPG